MNYYTSDILPNSGSTYSIKVNHPDYESISASTYIPEDIIVYNIQIDTETDPENPDEPVPLVVPPTPPPTGEEEGGDE